MSIFLTFSVKSSLQKFCISKAIKIKAARQEIFILWSKLLSDVEQYEALTQAHFYYITLSGSQP